MPIETSESGAIMITGDETRLFGYMQLIHGLGIEINTGMKLTSRGSVMVAAKIRCGSDKGTKRGVLQDMVRFTMAEFPKYAPGPNIIRAMGRKYLKTTIKEMLWLQTLTVGSEFDITAFPVKVRWELVEIGALKVAPVATGFVVGTVHAETLKFLNG